MASRVSKQVLQWEVIGEKEAAASFERVYGPITKSEAAVEELNAALNDLRVNAKSIDLGTQFGSEVNKGLKDSASAATELANELERAGASKGDLLAASKAFEEARLASSDDGGGGSGSSKLTQFGNKLRALPSIRIPGTETGSDSVANVLRLFGSLPPTMLAVGGAIGVFSGAILLLEANAKKATEAAKADLDAQARAVTLLRTGSQDTIQARINELNSAKQVNAELKKIADDNVDNIRKQNIAQNGGGAALVTEINSVLGTGGSELTAAKQRADEAAKAVSGTNVELETLTKQSGLAAQSLDQIAASARNVTYISSDLNNRVSADLEAVSLAYNGNHEQLVKRKQDLQNEKDVLSYNINVANSLADTYGRQTAEGAAAAKQADDLTKRYNAVGTTLQFISADFVDAFIKVREVADKQTTLAKDRASTTVKYNDDLTKATQDDLEKRAGIEKKYQDTLIQAAQTLVDAGDKALQTLKDKRSDLLQGLQRDQLTKSQKQQFDALQNQISIQEKSVAEAKQHQADLLQIQRDAANKEQDLIASRDFAGLFRSRRDTTKALQDSNLAFKEKQDAEALQNQQKTDADARQFAFEQAQRLQAYDFANQDAAKNYDRQIEQANAANQKVLQQAADARNTQLQIQMDGYKAQRDLLYSNTLNTLNTLSTGYTLAEQAAQKYAAGLLQSFALQSGLQGVPSAAGFPGAGVLNKNNSINNTTVINGSNAIDINALVSKTITKLLSGVLG